MGEVRIAWQFRCVSAVENDEHVPRDTNLAEMFESGARLVKASGNAGKVVMRLGRGTHYVDKDAANTKLLELSGFFSRQQGPIGANQRHQFSAAIAENIVKIGAE